MKPLKKTAALFFSRDIYREEAVRLAAAVFEDRAEISLARGKTGMSADVSGPENSAGEFCNEVLNQQCRLDLSIKNSRIASLISTKALLSAAGEKPAGRE
jgi:hypothetical protein